MYNLLTNEDVISTHQSGSLHSTVTALWKLLITGPFKSVMVNAVVFSRYSGLLFSHGLTRSESLLTQWEQLRGPWAKYQFDIFCLNMLRQISKGVPIDQVPGGSLMNSKNERNYFRVPRAVVARDHVK